MTRTQFNTLFAAMPDNWFEPSTLNLVNDLAFAWLAEISPENPNIEQLVKSAFDFANNTL